MSNRNKKITVEPSELSQHSAGHAANVGKSGKIAHDEADTKLAELPVFDGVTPDNVLNVRLAQAEKDLERANLKLARFNIDNELSNCASVIGQLKPKLKDEGARVRLSVSLKGGTWKDANSGSLEGLNERERKALAFVAQYETAIRKVLSLKAQWGEKSKH